MDDLDITLEVLDSEDPNQPNGAVSPEQNHNALPDECVLPEGAGQACKWHGTIISPDPRPIRREEVHLLCQVLPNCIMSMLYQCGTES
jgi:hypothetical protein